MALTKKQQVFIETYLTCWNATESARQAGYAFPNVEGTRLLVNASIKEQIEARLTELKMSADEVLIRLAEQARADMADFFRFQDGIKTPFLDLESANNKGLLRLVKKFKYNAAGHPEIELYDAQAALVHLGKAHGLFNTGAGESEDKPFIVKVVYGNRDQRANDTSTPAAPKTDQSEGG